MFIHACQEADSEAMPFGAKRTPICGFLLIAAGLTVLTQLPDQGAYLSNIFPAASMP
jgi:hypothetical protein